MRRCSGRAHSSATTARRAVSLLLVRLATQSFGLVKNQTDPSRLLRTARCAAHECRTEEKNFLKIPTKRKCVANAGNCREKPHCKAALTRRYLQRLGARRACRQHVMASGGARQASDCIVRCERRRCHGTIPSRKLRHPDEAARPVIPPVKSTIRTRSRSAKENVAPERFAGRSSQQWTRRPRELCRWCCGHERVRRSALKDVPIVQPIVDQVLPPLAVRLSRAHN